MESGGGEYVGYNVMENIIEMVNILLFYLIRALGNT
jgi:hypothetical protein